ncbi:TRPM8 channel-associated factor homolog [Scleropages formosus]|uniref:Zgc:162193 n=1 Tax=Scleropages formosus TaxID=113540 RepID=A0A8C9RFP1_SCLFO|nr:TRPM8 channel-associated factor homolog [Scleropages formosus]XP_018598448.1 TRPM8 channel-associated factor homolog [Scleropages formosus]
MAREAAYAKLMEGINELDFRGPMIPSDLVLIGDHAFPLVMNPRGQVLMAASSYGEGHLVAMGHEGCLTAFPNLVKNTLAWLKPPGESTVGIHQSCKDVANNLCPGLQAEVGEFHKGLGVYVTDAYGVGPKAQDLVSFLKEGGSLLVVGQAWHWAQQHPKRSALKGFPGNKVCGVAGIYFSEHQGELGVFPIPRQIPSSWLAVSIGKDFKEDLEELLEGVTEFNIQGGAIPSEILVHGPLAFPIATTDDARAFFAGAYYGQGRIVVGTHEGFLGRQELSRFLINALHWLDEGRKGCVGIQPHLDGAYSLLSQSGLPCEKTNIREGLSVFVCTSYSDENCARIQEFVAEGGGLLIAGHAWYWAQCHVGQQALTEYPGNRILNKMGLSILGSTLSSGLYKALKPDKASSEIYHFRHMLHRFADHVTCGRPLEQHEEERLKRLGHDCATYLHMQAHDCPSYTSILSVLTDVVKQAGVPQVGSKSPVEDAKDHLLLNVGSQLYKVSPNPDEIVPYIIQNEPRFPVVANTKVCIDGNAAGMGEWKSTGLYLTPGMRTYISVPPQIVGKGWAVQVGCQTDNIGNLGQLKRAPVVHESFPVDSEMMLVSNLWGGLLYLVAPPNSSAGDLEIVVQWAVKAPYYKFGKTTVEEWVGGLRDAPAPWAELEFENVILTVKSKMVRNLDRPDEVASLWNEIMRSIADLAVIPKFPRKERLVGDVQISHGFMHAGYPIMIHSYTAPELLNVKDIRNGGIWGAIHELGHNQQRSVWEFPPHTTECTCNLWSIYVHEELLKIPRHKAHEAIMPDNRKERLQQYVNEGKQLGSWEMWTALETYMQLQEEFGWDAFKKVFAAYHEMNNVPGDRDGKMNLYAETFSKVVGKNLAPFFKSWGWPIRPDLEEKLAGLPEWSNHPMAQYA